VDLLFVYFDTRIRKHAAKIAIVFLIPFFLTSFVVIATHVPSAYPDPETNTYSGMGAIPHEHGVAFRVWAPFASSVAVIGDFNGWDASQHPLTAERDGYWYADVAVAKIGQEYRYEIVNAESGKTDRRIDPYAREVTNSVGNAVVHDPVFDWGEQVFQMPAWNELVIYELHIGTFNDTPGGQPGNFDAAIARLEYLQKLGINAIKVMPASEFAADFSWGYNPANLFAIESAYGGPKAFKRFIKAAHQRGLAVLFDVVYNHLGPSDLDLWQFDGWSKNDQGGVYFFNDERSRTPWGDTRPDYGRPEVRQYLRDNAIMWLEDYRLDGLRWDSTVNIRTHFNGAGDIPEGWHLMQWVNDEINARFPWKISIAEDLQGNHWITSPTSKGGAGFDSQWDAAFVHPVRDAIIPPDDRDRNLYAVRDAIDQRYNNNAFDRVIYTESHDEVANGRQRVPSEIDPSHPGSWFARKRSLLGAALTLTSPGIPMLFQGQEILEDAWFRDTDPIDWHKLTTYNGIHTAYRDLIRLRRNWYVNTAGLRGQYVSVHHVNNADKVLGFHRWEAGGPGDDTIVIVNFGNRAYHSYSIGFPREGYWRVRFNSDSELYSEDFGNYFSYDTRAERRAKDGMRYSGNVGIGPYSVIILSQDPPQ
jgi:1,4-alpha-glucan branching enzyme